MKRLPRDLLQEMAAAIPAEDAAEMAIPSYLHKNPLLREMAWSRLHLLARWLTRVCRGRTGLTVLDYGCGSGVLLPHASKLVERVIGVDLVTAPAELLVRRYSLTNVEIMTPELAAKRVLPQSVDVIIAAEVLEHVEPIDPLVAQLSDWLRNDESRVLVSLPTENTLYRVGRRLAGFSGHYHHANAQSVFRQMQKAGFVVKDRRALPLPGPLAIYWCLAFSLGKSRAST